MEVSSVGLVEALRLVDAPPPPSLQYVIINVANKVKEDTTIGLFKATVDLIDRPDVGVGFHALA